jgi:hypothetical protein
MALDEIQWGRILAFAWLNKDFKAAFETNPTKALRDLKGQGGLGAELFEELGLDDNPPLVDLERIVDYPVDFVGVPEDRLIKIRKGDEPVRMPNSQWYWGLREDERNKGIATRSGTDEPVTTTQWGQIYARIWEDERSGGSDKKNYKARFERDPAAVVKEIAEESKAMEGMKPINYEYGVTPLYVFDPKPTDWDDEQLEGVVTTGKVNGQPLVWMVTKCC